MEMQNQEGEIRIYVACLASYNSGILHGRWIDAHQNPYAIWEAVSAMLLASPVDDAEEWAIHDYEGFEGAPISEYESFDSVSDKAAFIVEHGALGGKLVEHCGSVADAKKAIEEHYAGEHESLADFARELTEQTAQAVPDNLAFYIDYDAMGRDLAISDVFTIHTAWNELHVFWEG